MSALAGDNVVAGSLRMPWYHGPSLLEYLETVQVDRAAADDGFRLAVQRVVRPDQHFRGYAGPVASGTLRPGDELTVLPSGRRSRVRQISTFDGPLGSATAPMAVTVELEDHLDISRGDLLYAGSSQPHSARKFQARIVWMDGRPLVPRRRYLLKHTTRTVPAEILIRHRVRIATLEEEHAETLEMNDIGLVEVHAAQPLFFDPYGSNRQTGSFIVIDAETNATSGAGMIVGPLDADPGAGPVTPRERRARWGHAGAIVRIGGRAGLAQMLERRLFEQGCAVVRLRRGQDGIAEALAEAGLLAILPAHRLPGESPLPEGDTEACDAVLSALGLNQQSTIHQGEGI
jgi:sulfate adenylyltransferase subunit 1 (EFTu-like GTPase family)